MRSISTTVGSSPLPAMPATPFPLVSAAVSGVGARNVQSPRRGAASMCAFRVGLRSEDIACNASITRNHAMRIYMNLPLNKTRRSSLSLAIAVAIAMTGHAAHAESTSLAARMLAGTNVRAHIGDALRDNEAFAVPMPAPRGGNTLVVTSCADDGGFDTLRHAVLTASNGD